MATITMHGVDQALDKRVRKIARDQKTSINQTAQKILRDALGLNAQTVDNRSQFQEFAGRWSSDDLIAFEAQTKACATVDLEDWT